MATAKKPAVADGAGNWWRLFHSLLRHGRDAAENERSKATWEWMFDNYLTLKKVAMGARFDLLSAVWNIAQETGHLPAYEAVLERVQAMEKNEEPLDLLKNDYRTQTDLHAHAPEDLSAKLKDCCNDWERLRVYHALNKTNQICQGSEELGTGRDKKTWSGPRDAVKYLVQELEEGLLIDSTQTLKPIDVKRDAKLGPEEYIESLNIPQLECGFNQFYIERQDFVGILGYLGGGKSTMERFLLYKMAEAGRSVLHISIENNQTIERDKFVFLHAHNEKWGGKYAALTYAKKRKKELTPELLRMWGEVAADFEDLKGEIIIRKPNVANWENIKTMIETEDWNHKLDAVGIDYIQLLDPPSRSIEEQKTKMNSMIKDIRQFGMNFDGGRGLCIISPIQANEEGLSKAAVIDGVFKSSAINTDKELGRSMTFIIGVFNQSNDPQGEMKMMVSCPKDREGVGFAPFVVKMTGSGWMHTGGLSTVNDIKTTPETLDDELVNPAAGGGM